MKKTFYALTLLVAGVLFSNNLKSQIEEYPFSVGAIAGYTSYSGNYGSSVFNADQAFYGHFGFELGFYLTKRLSLLANLMRGDIGYIVWNEPGFTGGFNGGSALLKYRFLDEDVFFRPYLVAGIGANQYYGEKMVNSFNWLADGGVGFDLNLSKRFVFDLRLTGQYNFSANENENSSLTPTIESGDWTVLTTAGVRYQFGIVGDSDGDGINDNKDECPETPGLIQFNGCPDTDGDGIADKDDMCPTQAGLAEFQGCPDQDGDGIPDKADACPTEAGLAEFSGCPDSDGDGIPDINDDCPDSAGLAEFNGCPDRDGDGVTDAIDRCPDAAGSVELQGCPDKDGDGIVDLDDLCPEVAGILENKGCPEVKVEYIQTFTKALTGITFKASSDVIKSSSHAVLDDIVEIMNDNPHYKLYIAGYASSDGDDDFNLELSKKRAASVKKYIEDKGIASNRLRSDGFGEANPIADNSTSAGRAKNRRVEFTVEF